MIRGEFRSEEQLVAGRVSALPDLHVSPARLKLLRISPENKGATVAPLNTRTGTSPEHGPIQASSILRNICAASDDPKTVSLYDNEGNLLTKTRISDGQRWEFTWDYRNRLTQVLEKTSGGTVVKQANYVYDVFNRRIGSTVDSDGAGSGVPTTRWTMYDGPGLGAKPYIDWIDPDGSGPQPSTLDSRRLSADTVDTVLARWTAGSGAVAWYLTDKLGSVRDVANNSGTVLDHINYDSFGNIRSESNPSNGDRFKFTGYEHDSETGLYQARARSYDAATARFVSPDPISFAAGDANLYRYLQNQPTTQTDPLGLAPQYPGAPPDFDYAAYMGALAAWSTSPNGASGGYAVGPGPAPGGGNWYDIYGCAPWEWIAHPLNCLYTGHPHPSDSEYQEAMTAAGMYWYLYYPLRGGYAFAAVEGATHMSPPDPNMWEVIGVSGWDIDDGRWDAVIPGLGWETGPDGGETSVVVGPDIPIGDGDTEPIIIVNQEIGNWDVGGWWIPGTSDAGAFGGAHVGDLSGGVGVFIDVSKLKYLLQWDFWAGNLPIDVDDE